MDGVVRLRMQGSCHGCPSSAMTLKNAIEEAIYATAPDVAAIEVEGVVEPPVHAAALFPIVTLDPRLRDPNPGSRRLEVTCMQTDSPAGSQPDVDAPPVRAETARSTRRAMRAVRARAGCRARAPARAGQPEASVQLRAVRGPVQRPAGRPVQARPARHRISCPSFRLSDEQWEDLHLPINLTFFVESTPAQRVLAFYPSPAGAVESLLTLEAWQALRGPEPVLAGVRARRRGISGQPNEGERAYYRAPIDECFKLVGLIRVHWRGLSGGTEVWDEVARFFASLNERSRPR